MNIDQLRQTLERHQQTQVLRFWDQLDLSGKQKLSGQLESIEFDQLDSLVQDHETKQDFAAIAAAAEPPPAVRRTDGSGPDWTLEQAEARGEMALSAGEVGALIVAGGQGTRLGFDQPKGMFKIGPVSGRTLFEFFADRIIATSQKYHARIPLYVMTSDATDLETIRYFAENDNLGLPPRDVRIFRQGTMPAVDSATGKLLLSEKDSLALSPDGHGGTVAALDRNGCLSDMMSRGVKYLSYIQVDNPLAHLCDPTLLGHHLLSRSEMTTHVIRKRYPMEKVGNVVCVGGAVQIVEYSDLPDEAAKATGDNGELRLWAGNTGVHVFNVDFLARSSRSSEALPFHRASKVVGHLDESGRQVSPESPNATKFERFIFDLLPQAKNAFVVECLPELAFVPVKNADGAEHDTPSRARAAISDLHAGWLQQCGVSVADQAKIEINPRYSLSPAELEEKISANLRIDTDRYFDE